MCGQAINFNTKKSIWLHIPLETKWKFLHVLPVELQGYEWMMKEVWEETKGGGGGGDTRCHLREGQQMFCTPHQRLSLSQSVKRRQMSYDTRLIYDFGWDGKNRSRIKMATLNMTASSTRLTSFWPQVICLHPQCKWDKLPKVKTAFKVVLKTFELYFFSLF